MRDLHEKQSVANIVALQLFLAIVFHWLEHKAPKWLLIISVVGFGYLGSRSVALLERVGEFFVPSVRAFFAGSLEWPLLVACWSLVLLFVAACSLHKQIAFLAAVQLYNRFRVVVAS